MSDDIKSKSVSIESNQWVEVCQLPSFHRHVHSLFEEMIHRQWGHAHWHPAVDIVETADAFIVEADVPGVDPDDINITANTSSITIHGRRKVTTDELCPICVHTTERPMGNFHYKAQFPGTLDTALMTFTHKNGVLTIRLPKKIEDRGQK